MKRLSLILLIILTFSNSNADSSAPAPIEKDRYSFAVGPLGVCISDMVYFNCKDENGAEYEFLKDLKQVSQIHLRIENSCFVHKNGLSCWDSNLEKITFSEDTSHVTQAVVGVGFICTLSSGKLTCYSENRSRKIKYDFIKTPLPAEIKDTIFKKINDYDFSVCGITNTPVETKCIRYMYSSSEFYDEVKYLWIKEYDEFIPVNLISSSNRGKDKICFVSSKNKVRCSSDRKRLFFKNNSRKITDISVSQNRICILTSVGILCEYLHSQLSRDKFESLIEESKLSFMPPKQPQQANRIFTFDNYICALYGHKIICHGDLPTVLTASGFVEETVYTIKNEIYPDINSIEPTNMKTCGIVDKDVYCSGLLGPTQDQLRLPDISNPIKLYEADGVVCVLENHNSLKCLDTNRAHPYLSILYVLDHSSSQPILNVGISKNIVCILSGKQVKCQKLDHRPFTIGLAPGETISKPNFTFKDVQNFSLKGNLLVTYNNEGAKFYRFYFESSITVGKEEELHYRQVEEIYDIAYDKHINTSSIKDVIQIKSIRDPVLKKDRTCILTTEELFCFDSGTEKPDRYNQYLRLNIHLKYPSLTPSDLKNLVVKFDHKSICLLRNAKSANLNVDCYRFANSDFVNGEQCVYNEKLSQKDRNLTVVTYEKRYSTSAGPGSCFYKYRKEANLKFDADQSMGMSDLYSHCQFSGFDKVCAPKESKVNVFDVELDYFFNISLNDQLKAIEELFVLYSDLYMGDVISGTANIYYNALNKCPISDCRQTLSSFLKTYEFALETYDSESFLNFVSLLFKTSQDQILKNSEKKYSEYHQTSFFKGELVLKLTHFYIESFREFISNEETLSSLNRLNKDIARSLAKISQGLPDSELQTFVERYTNALSPIAFVHPSIAYSLLILNGFI